MDDLFRKAAEQYPILTDNADWGTVQQRLFDDTITGKKVAGASDHGQFYKAGLLVLFVLIPLIITVTQFHTVGGARVAVLENRMKKNISHATDSNEQVKMNSIFSSENQENEIVKNKMILSGTAVPPGLQKPQMTGKEDGLISRTGQESNKNTNRPNKSTENSMIAAGDSGLKNNAVKESLSAAAIKDVGPAPEKSSDTQAGTTKTAAKDESIPVRNNRSMTSRKIFLGLVAGPEYAIIKGQQLSTPGFNIGILAGYRLNSRLSAELGVAFTHKNYFTDGKYVAPNSIRRDGSEIINVNAFNSITEIPVTIRYNLHSNAKGSFYTAAGGVSYIIHKERYTYWYDKNGEEKRGTRYNNKSSNNWFSNIQFSAGYEKHLGVTDIRVESYYRLPLSGIGISDLPVTSFGFNVAITTNPK